MKNYPVLSGAVTVDRGPLPAPPLPASAIPWLAEIGVFDTETLRQRGPVLVFLQLKSRGRTVTRKLLFALAAAYRGLHWRQLDKEAKEDLIRELAEHPPVILPPTEAEISRYMGLALRLADQAKSEGEIPVGAVIISRGEVIGRGYNQPVVRHDPSAHAEILALRDAAARQSNYRLAGCDLYVTLEPCVMCSGAMMHARISRVIYGAPDARAGAAGSALNVFAEGRLNHHTTVFGNQLSDPCAELLRSFFRARRKS